MRDEADRSGRMSTRVVHVAEARSRTPKGHIRCEIGRDIQFSTESLETYFFARWEPVAYDALLVAAAVEFADVTHQRHVNQWARDIEIRIPVHDPLRWGERQVLDALHDALRFVTGDRWHLSFYHRKAAEAAPRQDRLVLRTTVDAVVPFSNGLDSRAVAGLFERKLGGKVARVRLGSERADGKVLKRERVAFTSVPYRVKPEGTARRESSSRSRGFKFAMISAIAAYLADAALVLVPESGQGALGPALVAVGQSYEDYRSHPLFGRRMEILVRALFGRAVRYGFPQIWQTKGETLRQFVTECGDQSWSLTWSCWQGNRHVSVDGKKRQCGVCAACLLRRMSVHAADLSESPSRYVWESLTVPDFASGAAASFPRRKITKSLREYAIAGALHLDHLAVLPTSKTNEHALALAAFGLAGTLELEQADVEARLMRLLRQHAKEWHNFVSSLGAHSFIAPWAVGARS